MSGFSASGHDPATDRAVALIGDLETHKSDEPRIADPMERLTARVIDLCVWFAIFFITMVVANAIDLRFFPEKDLVRSPNGQTFYDQRLHPAVSWGALGAMIVAAWLYETAPASMRGRHLAKRRMWLRVVGRDGNPPSFSQATLRWFACMTPIIVTFVLAMGMLVSGWGLFFVALQFAALAIPGAMFLTDDHRGLHDCVAGTRVLSDR